MTCRTTVQPEAQPETKHGSPFDRGQADAYYGRPPIPHKTVKTREGIDGVHKSTSTDLPRLR